jgi:hypothetical protein
MPLTGQPPNPTRHPQVGFMAATSQVDVPLLQRSFDLHPYDGLLRPEVYDVQEAHARMMASRKVSQAPASRSVAECGSGQVCSWLVTVQQPAISPEGSRGQGGGGRLLCFSRQPRRGWQHGGSSLSAGSSGCVTWRQARAATRAAGGRPESCAGEPAW